MYTSRALIANSFDAVRAVLPRVQETDSAASVLLIYGVTLFLHQVADVAARKLVRECRSPSCPVSRAPTVKV